jgi:ABC-type methionine transport system ATPase subunit
LQEADRVVARTTVRLTFRGDTLNDPIIYRLGQDFKVITNIRRADVAEDSGWVELDVDGEPAEVDRALEYCRSRGIGVQRLEPA